MVMWICAGLTSQADPDAYCRTIEARLRELRAETGRVPSVAPMEVEALVQFASEDGLDPDTAAARSRFAARRPQ